MSTTGIENSKFVRWIFLVESAKLYRIQGGPKITPPCSRLRRVHLSDGLRVRDGDKDVRSGNSDILPVVVQQIRQPGKLT